MDDEEVPPLSPVRVTLFVLFLAGLAFGGWRLYLANKAVADVKEASKDYRRLFPSRAQEAANAPAPIPAVSEVPAKSGMMLQVDEDMKPPKPEPAAPPPAAEPAPPPVEAPAPVVKADAPAKPAPKAFNRPKLNSGAFSTLNGGSGIGISGGVAGGGGGKTAAPAGAAPAAAAAGMPDLSKLVPETKK